MTDQDLIQALLILIFTAGFVALLHALYSAFMAWRMWRHEREALKAFRNAMAEHAKRFHTPRHRSISEMRKP